MLYYNSFFENSNDCENKNDSNVLKLILRGILGFFTTSFYYMAI